MHSKGGGWRVPIQIMGMVFWCVVSAQGGLRSELVASGFSSPVFATAPPGDAKRLFVAEQGSGTTARIRIIDFTSGTVRSTPFITISGVLTGGERGLLGLAFHPNYAANGFFYVNFTASGGGAGGHTEIARYRVTGDPASSNVADPASKVLVLSYNQPEDNHNGGWLGFGNDGFLYIASGDGGGGGDQHGTIGNGQDRTTLLGKILRIDVNNGSPYAIPFGNPYAGDPTFRQEIWAFGLRNPWRCGFDHQTGDLWVADVGQGQREEIDIIPAGAGGLNFGWRAWEGTFSYSGETPVTTPIAPVYDYGRTLGGSVTGGYRYRGNAVPELGGKYIFADFSSSRFWTLTQNGPSYDVAEVTSQVNPSFGLVSNPSSFGEDAAGEIYVVEYSGGRIYRIESDAPAHPVAGDDTFSRPRSDSGKVTVFQLLANDADAQGHPLSVLGVSSPTANGGTVLLDGNWVIYQPQPGFQSQDTFTYLLSDGFGSTDIGAVTVTVAATPTGETKNIVSITSNGSDLTIRVAGIPGRVYLFQTTSNLSPPVQWNSLSSAPAAADGIAEVTINGSSSQGYIRAVLQ